MRRFGALIGLILLVIGAILAYPRMTAVPVTTKHEKSFYPNPLFAVSYGFFKGSHCTF
jgi:hypothetical protein